MDKRYGKEAYKIRNNEAAIRQEIYYNGPVFARFKEFEDFSDYRYGNSLGFTVYGRIDDDSF